MVVDILQSEEGKKAVQEAQASGSGPAMQMKMLKDDTQLKMTIKDVLTAPDFHKQMEKIMTDPKFSGDFAKAISKENKQLHKDLIKDPDYQKAVGEIIKTSEFDKMILDVMKSSQYRKQTMMVMQESIDNPLFKLKMMKLLEKVVEEQLKPDKKQGGGEGGGGGGGGGGSSGGGGGKQ